MPVHTIGYNAKHREGSSALLALLIMVLLEREKKRENDRESLMNHLPHV